MNNITQADPFSTELDNIQSLRHHEKEELRKQRIAEELLDDLKVQIKTKKRIGDVSLLDSLDIIGNYYVYLIHFDRGLSHASHYCGMSHDLHYRLDQHSCGGHDSSKIMKAVYRAGIPWTLVKVWAFDTIDQAVFWEHKIKRKNPWYCPICKPQQLALARDRMRTQRKKSKEPKHEQSNS